MPPSQPTFLDESDAALLLFDLRRLWRTWQERASSSPPGPAAHAYQQAMLDLAAVVEDRDRRRRAWSVLRKDLADAVAERLGADGSH
jgi:hypothetical protein